MTTETPTAILDRYIKARYTLIGIVSHEETRVLAAIREVASTMKLSSGQPAPRRVVEWSLTAGLVGLPDVGDDTSEPLLALDIISKFDEPGRETPTLFVLKDLHKILESDIKAVRYLRDIAARFEGRKHNVILLSPVLTVPADVEKTLAVIDWPLPDVDELADILNQVECSLPKTIKVTLNGNRGSVIEALRGLTVTEVSNVLSAAVVATRELGECVIPLIIREKAQIIKKSGVLEFYDRTVTMSEVGGLSALKRYAAIKRAAFSPKAREFGVDAPKGLLMVGVPGTGKSLSAKAIAGGKMPLLRMDVGALMGGLVGQSEGNMRSALKVAEAVAPCVLWVDEIEKALGGMGGEMDGGTTTRVFGTLLTWMQETTAPVYVVATANDVRSLRPELLRRFDDVMWVDLPDAGSRGEIFAVHLSKRGYDAGMVYEHTEIIDAAWGFSGAEIEKVVKSAIAAAFADGETLTADRLLDSARSIVPISKTMADQIADLRRWASDKAISAGTPLEAQPVLETSLHKGPEL
jgi:ATP-dependent 26S proteasome regulatory subunit